MSVVTPLCGALRCAQTSQWRPIHYADPAPEPVIADNDKTNPAEWSAVAEKLENNAGYRHVQIKQQSDTLIMTVSNRNIGMNSRATDRVAAILANNADPECEITAFSNNVKNMPVEEHQNRSGCLRKAKSGVILGDKTPAYSEAVKPELTAGNTLYQTPSSPLDFSLSPSLTQPIGARVILYVSDWSECKY